ncbi:phosphate signaling complex protein PhoU [Pseudactinotalea sp. HY158]|uniref:phosphate signaling complex protein PhoU n=1 Tax=unclassified Pseudactinotalea TaxID=2649176 RepID=UPI00129C8088|nr:phosphate signaling complex protein PhoU [Pseudactinotalea sp. HY158]MPV48440.1 phosphate signaling complex protein PhoU [Pseudactinotalea sp. HY160]QGH68419.1 phosphate signaling complex protein PhoU [Pseudactinotalea sp. HY158]
MRAIFTQELSQVGDDLVSMSRQVATAITDATTALLEGDLELAERVIDADAAVDELERELDERCVMLLARQQPVASDLRLVVSALRMSSSIERMGDLARHVAQVARLRYPNVAIPETAVPVFHRLGEAAKRVAGDVVELLESHDLSLALRVERDDDVLDQLHLDTFRLTLAQNWPGTTAETVDVTLTARFYERFGDHAVNVARRIQYLVTGDFNSGVDD